MTDEPVDRHPRTEADAVAEVAQQATRVTARTVEDADGNEVYRYFFHGDQLVHEVLTDHLQRHPRQLTGQVQAHTADGLIAYASRHALTDASTLWGALDDTRITVVFNDHNLDGTPGWGDHRAVLDLEHSPAFSDWLKHNEKDLSQEQLATFLEERTADVIEPSGSTLLDVARTFHATTGATFRRAQSTHSGEVQLTYREEIDGKAGQAGETEVPREFRISVPIFLGGEPIAIDGRFRYRVRQGQLTLGFRLLNLTETVHTVVREILGEVAGQLDLEPIEAAARAPRR